MECVRSGEILSVVKGAPEKYSIIPNFFEKKKNSDDSFVKLARGCSEELHYDRPAISPPLRLSFYVSV